MPQTQIRDQLLTKFRSGCSTRSWQKWAPSILQADSAFAPDQSGILQDARLYSSLFDSTPPSASVQRLAAFLRSARNARIVILLGHGLTSHGPISLSENWMLVQADPLERHLRFVRRGDILASIAGYISPSWFLAQLSASCLTSAHSMMDGGQNDTAYERRCILASISRRLTTRMSYFLTEFLQTFSRSTAM
eukprot:m.109485 g.109485  ORF g.109485 m.109485 type:complete len:192 (+) comp51766_c0_seq6:164-739(+)